ncbi:MAG TPA: hypothetical protein VF230_02250 [Acidimicrobiales bacterium]
MKADRTRFVAAAVVGAVLALFVELALLLEGAAFLAYEPLGDVFDAQARSLLDGRWDIPADVIKIEGFRVDGKTYTYFGPVPALLRVPVVAVTDGFDGRLTRLSLLLAWMVTLAVATRFAWRARSSARGDAAVGRREQVVVAAWTLAIGAGSSVTFLAARPGVFHEAIAWGIALSLVALDAVDGWARRPTGARLALLVIAVTAALLTRASVGAAPAIALALLVAARAVRGVRARDAHAARTAVAGVIVLTVAGGAYVAVNVAKFGTLASVPFERHVVTMVNEHRREVLAENGGTIQGPQFIPTTLLHYVRPDAIGWDGAFPWVDFPRRATVVGDVLMDEVDVASSVPSAMPALTLAAGIGVVALVRRRGPLAVLAVGAGACLAVTLAIGFVAHRYTADGVPLLVVAGSVGLARLRSRFAAAGLVALCVASVPVTAALTIQFQQHYGFLTSSSLRAQLAARQLELPMPDDPVVVRVDAEEPLPKVARDRTFAVVGACAGLYRSDGRAWQPVERTPATGRFVLAVSAPGTAAVALPAGVELQWRGDEAMVHLGDATSRDLRAPRDRPLVLEVVGDRRLGFVEVRRNGEHVLDGYYSSGDEPVVPPESAGVRVLPAPTPVCDELTGRSS